ncbi:hypothetical protein CCR85_01135 [Rhodothalassium salexigens]|uniref:hypothetical protein n=1 Tax=Rhodothalassium salexigens TaxID=1086 RepID=UPI001914C792|nr:hypothetical protein [Rhodothalassium salexigens]MBK5910097.1 hypothetical protein [Rhodothalassium salexigens]
MTTTSTFFEDRGCAIVTDEHIEALGERVGAFLRAAMPGEAKAKMIARRYAVSLSTAEKWLAGSPPGVKWLAMLINDLGAPFVRHVFEPLLGEASLSQRADRLVADMELLRKDLAHVDEATRRTLDLARAGDSVDGAGAGQRGLSAGAARGSDGGARDQAAPARPGGRLSGAARGLGVWLAGLALGLALADGGGWLPVPDDQAAQPIMQRAPRGGQHGRSLRLRQGREFDM